jgi:mRNA interferase RelE/StbE
MAKYAVMIERNAMEALKKMDKAQANIILAWVNKNLVDTENPRQHGKGLSGNQSGKWRYRVGDYRLIADISENTVTILVLDIGHRSKIYRS